MSPRHSVLFALCVALASSSAAAQGLCAYSKPAAGVPHGPGAPRAVQEVDSVLRALGVRLSVSVEQGPVANAAAFLGSPPRIVYNPSFLSGLDRVNRWAAMSVLAHEVGHHVDPSRWSPNPWSRELGADFVSGCALARLGASLVDATAALRSMPTYGGPDSP